MGTWARLEAILGIDYEIRGGHKLVGTNNSKLPLEKGAQSAHFRYYWTEERACKTGGG